MGDVWLGPPGHEELITKNDRQLIITDLDIIREARTSAGNLVVDEIARKKIFYLHYDKIKGPDLENIVALQGQGNLNLIITNRDGGTDDFTVRFRPLERRRWRITGDWIWRDVVIILEEI